MQPSPLDLLGKLWNAPNTLIGLGYGAAGMLLGFIACAIRIQSKPPRVRLAHNALQFTNNPLGGVGALTLGNTVTWIGDPFDPDDRVWRGDGGPILENGHTIVEHEEQHTWQGQVLGPLYVPSNILGGLNSLLRGEGWHGPHNWNERGPQSNPPRPWAPFPRPP